jgi:hypothetical protein
MGCNEKEFPKGAHAMGSRRFVIKNGGGPYEAIFISYGWVSTDFYQRLHSRLYDYKK